MAHFVSILERSSRCRVMVGGSGTMRADPDRLEPGIVQPRAIQGRRGMTTVLQGRHGLLAGPHGVVLRHCGTRGLARAPAKLRERL